MNEEAAFITAIRANPADDLTRLVYADWLQDRDRDLEAQLQRIRAELRPLNPHPIFRPLQVTMRHGFYDRSIMVADLRIPRKPGSILPVHGWFVDVLAGLEEPFDKVLHGLRVRSYNLSLSDVGGVPCIGVTVEFDTKAEEHPHRARVNELRIAEARILDTLESDPV